MGAKWSEKERQYLVDNYTTTDMTDLCKELKRTETAILSQAWLMKLKKDGRRYITIGSPIDEEKIDSIAALQNVCEEGKLLIKMLNKCKKMPDCVKSALDRFAKLTEKAEKVRQYEYGFKR